VDVFLLYDETSYGEWDVLGVYSTLERAQAAYATIGGEVEWKIDREGRWLFLPDAGHAPVQWSPNGPRRRHGAQIERHTVDS
jgi:hypothetical protein